MEKNMKEKIFRAFNPEFPIKALDGDVLELSRRYLPQTDAERYSIDAYDRAFLVRFTYNSNSIEGSTLTLGDTALVLEGEFPSDVRDKKLSDAFAAKGISEAIEYVEELRGGKSLPVDITEDLVREVHARTALDCQPRTRGIYRSSFAAIVGSQTVPVSPSSVRESMADLLFAYSESSLEPIERAAAFHAMFEHIHPFQDGNGRTGRILMNVMLENHSLPPIAIAATAKADYLSALESWQVRDDRGPLVRMVRDCAISEALARFEAVTETRVAFRDAIGEPSPLSDLSRFGRSADMGRSARATGKER